jgi:hypothetical protein
MTVAHSALMGFIKLKLPPQRMYVESLSKNVIVKELNGRGVIICSETESVT